MNDEAFYMDFTQIVDFKWSEDAWLAYIKTLLQILFIVLLNIDTVHIKNDQFSKVNSLTSVVTTFNIFFLIWQCIQIMFQGILNALQDIKNNIFLIGNVTYIISYGMMIEKQ